MTELAQFHDRAAMQRASDRFVKALRGKPVRVENVAERRLTCGHEQHNLYVYRRQTLCRKCRSTEVRNAQLPGQLEAARARVAMLERQARESGAIL